MTREPLHADAARHRISGNSQPCAPVTSIPAAGAMFQERLDATNPSRRQPAARGERNTLWRSIIARRPSPPGNATGSASR
jgi:hypothetical protein